MSTQNLTDMRNCINENLGEKSQSPKLKFEKLKFGELSAKTNAEHIIAVLRWLRDDAKTQFIVLIDICGVDYPDQNPRFEVVYHLLSPRHNVRLRLKIATDVKIPVPSAVGLFRAAEWFEREIYDMYGILFADHPDLRRLLTDYGFEGHPLRKDFPLTGFSQIRYDEKQKKVIYEPVELRQEFRDFDFLSPWQGDPKPTKPEPLPGDEKAGEAK